LLLLRGFCARINHPFILRYHLHCPPWCNTIARLLASIRPPPTYRAYALHHTILVITISCKGQGGRHLSVGRVDAGGARERSLTTLILLLGVGLYKIFVCLFGDCALVNTILGIQHLLYCTPPLSFEINIAQYMNSPRPPCFPIQHTILVMAILCKGQTGGPLSGGRHLSIGNVDAGGARKRAFTTLLLLRSG